MPAHLQVSATTTAKCFNLLMKTFRLQTCTSYPSKFAIALQVTMVF